MSELRSGPGIAPGYDSNVHIPGGIPDPLEVERLRVELAAVFGSAVEPLTDGEVKVIGAVLKALGTGTNVVASFGTSADDDNVVIRADGTIEWDNGAKFEPHPAANTLTAASLVLNLTGGAAKLSVGSAAALYGNTLELQAAAVRLVGGTAAGRRYVRFQGQGSGGAPNWLQVEAVPRSATRNASGAVTAWNWTDSGTCQEITLQANTTLTPTVSTIEVAPMGQYQVLVRQDAVGGRTCAWDSAVDFGSGSFVMPAAPNACTIVSLVWDDVNARYMAVQGWSD